MNKNTIPTFLMGAMLFIATSAHALVDPGVLNEATYRATAKVCGGEKLLDRFIASSLYHNQILQESLTLKDARHDILRIQRDRESKFWGPTLEEVCQAIRVELGTMISARERMGALKEKMKKKIDIEATERQRSLEFKRDADAGRTIRVLTVQVLDEKARVCTPQVVRCEANHMDGSSSWTYPDRSGNCPRDSRPIRAYSGDLAWVRQVCRL